MNQKLNRIAVSFFVITVFILLFITYFSFQRLQNLIRYTNQVNSTHELRLEITNLLSLLKDAETGQRGFLLTRDTFFLEPYIKALPAIDSSYGHLNMLTAHRPMQKQRLLEIYKLIVQKKDYMSRSLSAPPDKSALQFRTNMLRGKATMDEIRRSTAKMLEVESRILGDLMIEKERYEALTPVFLLVLSMFALLLVTGTFLIIRRQLHQRMLIQAELQDKIDALNRSNSELEQFAYVASHDLQEPLRKIQAFGDKLILKHAAGLEQEGVFAVERMRNAAGRMQSLINELLSFSRLTQKGTEEMQPVALNDTIREVLGDLQLLLQEKQPLIEKSPLPVVHAIPTQMRQLFQNLLSNALKFAKKDVTPQITITADIVNGTMIKLVKAGQQHQQFHRITVADNGIGFDEEYQDKIFIIFQRLHGKLEYSGTGIGLAVCQRICSNHGGYIQAQSEKNKGSKFLVFLPVKQVNN